MENMGQSLLQNPHPELLFDMATHECADLIGGVAVKSLGLVSTKLDI